MSIIDFKIFKTICFKKFIPFTTGICLVSGNKINYDGPLKYMHQREPIGKTKEIFGFLSLDGGFLPQDYAMNISLIF